MQRWMVMRMAEYIEKDNLIRWIERQKRLSKLHTILAIQDTPASDVEKVVRCKKCLYRSQYSDENGMYKCGGILTEDGDCFLMVKPDHFCAYGERRGGE